MDAIFDSREFFGKNRKTTENIFVRREWLHKRKPVQHETGRVKV